MSNVIVEANVAAAMRDGTVLRADVYRPESGRHPALLQRTPYNKELWPVTALTLDPVRAARAGYAVVIQDVRGRWTSDGDYVLYGHEADDGHDTLAWAAAQPWSHGTAAAYGVSYMGATAWLAASTAPPSLRAIAPTTAPCDFFRNAWPGGALALGLHVQWWLSAIAPAQLVRTKRGSPDLGPSLVQLIDDIDAFDDRVGELPLSRFGPARPEDSHFLPHFFEVLRHPTRDEFHRSLLMSGRHASVGVPALIVAGWHDLLLQDDLEHFAAMRKQAATEEARRNTRIVIGPWSHGTFLNVVGDVDFGFRSNGLFLDLREDLTTLHLRWFDRWCKGVRNGVEEEAPVRLFVQGRNRWRDEDAWPLARAVPTRFHLRHDGRLTREAPVSDEAPVAYVYDPADPCPTRGGRLLMPRTYPPGPVDQGPLLGRRDVLVYTSDPLAEDLEITGPITAVLYGATTGADTDWVVKLCAVEPEGRTLNVCDGVLRARYRNSVTEPTLVEPGAVERYQVDLAATSVVLPVGHRLRVLVTSSDFPRYDRNPNTGELGVEATATRPALQTIFHDAGRASHLLLPVVA